jgi:hypothetical protein
VIFFCVAHLFSPPQQQTDPPYSLVCLASRLVLIFASQAQDRLQTLF